MERDSIHTKHRQQIDGPAQTMTNWQSAANWTQNDTVQPARSPSGLEHAMIGATLLMINVVACLPRIDGHRRNPSLAIFVLGHPIISLM
jgi:hypothetical protein